MTSPATDRDGTRATLRRLLPLRAKQVLAKLALHPLVGRAVGQIYGDLIPTSGFRIDVSLPAVHPSIKAAIFLGMYESAETRCVARHLRDDLDVVDLGSSLGVIACHIDRKLEPGRRLICVEADAFLCGTVASNLRRNAPLRHAMVLSRAVHYGAGAPTVLFSGGSSNTGHVDADASEAYEVRTATLSQILSEADVRGPYTLFADIEGAEAGIVFEDGAALANCQQIIAELHRSVRGDRYLSPEALVQALEQRHGFRVTTRDGNVWVLDRGPA